MGELSLRLVGAILIYFATAVRFYYEKRTKVRAVESVRHLRIARGAATLSSWTWFALLIFLPIPGFVPVNGLPFARAAVVPLQIVGLVILATSVALFYWCHRALGEFWFGEPGLKAGHELIRVGPYRWIRHPMYTSFFTGYVGALLLLQSWPFLIPILFAPGFYVMSRVEEEILEQRFPDAYARYRAEAGRFLPKLS